MGNATWGFGAANILSEGRAKRGTKAAVWKEILAVGIIRI